MGISLREIVPGRELELEELSGRKLAVDAYNILYQFLSSIRDRFTGEPLKDSRGRVTSHLSGLFYRNANLIGKGIKLVYVFDGKPPEFKRETSEARREVRRKAEVKWKEAVKKGDVEAVKRYSQQASRLTDEMVEEAKKLLGTMGIPVVQAPSEGEAQCSWLCRKGLVYATASQDFDSLAFGSPRLVRNINITGRRKVPGKEKYITIMPEIIELEDALKSLGISRDQLIILGILTGTDYNPGGIKGIGPKTALKMVRENRTLDGVLKQVKWEFRTPAREIFDFFKKPPVKETEIGKARFDPEKLREILVEEHDFSRERFDSVMKKLQESEEAKKQTGLERFMR